MPVETGLWRLGCSPWAQPSAAATSATRPLFRPVKEVGLYAADPLVLAAGGTSLNADRATGAYISETARKTTTAAPVATAEPGPPGLSSPPALSSPARAGVITEASGGGFSQVFRRPAYQDGVPGTGRAVAYPTWPRTPTPPPA